jgi:hypothetical protein
LISVRLKVYRRRRHARSKSRRTRKIGLVLPPPRSVSARAEYACPHGAQKAEQKKEEAERKRKEDIERARKEMERRIAFLTKHGV